MPDLTAQLEPHDGYVELPVIGYSVWWRDEDEVRCSGRMPLAEVDQTLRHLNHAYYPLTFWPAPVYEWERLIEAALDDPFDPLS